MLSNPSSNWKALQKKLQAAKTTNGAPTKRKRQTENEEAGHIPKKFKQTRVGASKSVKQKLLQRKAMSHDDNVQRARSQSAPQKLGRAESAALKQSSSHADLKTVVVEDTVNEGNSATHVAGKYVAVDCEMVGIGPAPHATSQLARVSLVNVHGEQIYDSFVLPKFEVTDYRTHVSGITSSLLAQGRPFEEVQHDVGTLMKGRILVGHAVKNDLAVLLLSHPKSMIRDTSHHKPWKEQFCNGGIPSLRTLARSILGWESFQEGKHSSVEDARATMMLYKQGKEAFEVDARRRFGDVHHKPPAADKPLDPGGGQIEVTDGSIAVKKKRQKKRKKGKK